ncbi:hypothetical protein [Kitasatospora sp. NPDC085879]|uniref:hypothetical protein n=1 Tax=Kitasatospora sp. NPDC085879 TaxID=3154769 RepID=UPI001186DC8A|nr:hypothetical protein [Streptomyces sp. TLI_235]
MSETVIIVAAITAISTLAASAIASMLALRSSRQQISLQEKLADKEHDERRAVELREVRRQAYLDFLGSIDSTMNELRKVRGLRLTDEEYKEWDSSVTKRYNNALFCSRLVAIAGPESLDSKAAELWAAVAVEVRAMRRNWETTGKVGAPQEIRDKRTYIQEDFASASRRALGGDD